MKVHIGSRQCYCDNNLAYFLAHPVFTVSIFNDNHFSRCCSRPEKELKFFVFDFARRGQKRGFAVEILTIGLSIIFSEIYR